MARQVSWKERRSLPAAILVSGGQRPSPSRVKGPMLPSIISPSSSLTRTRSLRSFVRRVATGVSLPGDIREEGFCNKLVADTVRELGGLDILVNNAAFQQSHASLSDISTQDFDDTSRPTSMRRSGSPRRRCLI